MVNQPEMEFRFDNIDSRPTPSLLRSFSAQVNLEFEHSDEQLLLLMQHDNNTYNRCEAAKKLITQTVGDYCSGKPLLFLL